jgi:hypothetical protein
LIGIFFVVAAVFFILKKFSLPASFYENQTKREEMVRSKIQQENAVVEKKETEDAEQS